MDSEDHENMRFVTAAMRLETGEVVSLFRPSRCTKFAFPFSSKCCRVSRASSKRRPRVLRQRNQPNNSVGRADLSGYVPRAMKKKLCQS